MIFPRVAAALLVLLVGVAAAPRLAEAQYLNRSAQDGFDSGDPTDPGPDRDSSVLTTRVDRLERELRKATGQIEELQHQVQGLEDQLRTHQDSALPPSVASHTPPPAGAGPRAASGDAFDPAANPTAIGAPRALGQTVPSAPLPATATRGASRDPGAPMDLTPPGLQSQPPAAEAPPPAISMKDEYDQAAALMQQQQYEAAEHALTAFLVRYPKSKYVPAATFGLGESFFLRSRFREAAEKFLEIKKRHPQSAQTPEALLRLGQSLAEIGAHEEACQSFAEIGASYPNSSARVRDSAQREMKRRQC